jgi:hypothetical protein
MREPSKKLPGILLNCGMLECLPYPVRRRRFDGLSMDIVPMVVHLGFGSSQPISGG